MAAQWLLAGLVVDREVAREVAKDGTGPSQI